MVWEQCLVATEFYLSSLGLNTKWYRGESFSLWATFVQLQLPSSSLSQCHLMDQIIELGQRNWVLDKLCMRVGKWEPGVLRPDSTSTGVVTTLTWLRRMGPESPPELLAICLGCLFQAQRANWERKV